MLYFIRDHDNNNIENFYNFSIILKDFINESSGNKINNIIEKLYQKNIMIKKNHIGFDIDGKIIKGSKIIKNIPSKYKLLFNYLFAIKILQQQKSNKKIQNINILRKFSFLVKIDQYSKQYQEFNEKSENMFQLILEIFEQFDMLHKTIKLKN